MRGPRFEHHVAIVTGAGAGIGRATAMAFATEGARVLVADIDGERAQETVDLINAAGGTAVSCRTDVADEAAVSAMCATAVERFGRLDVLHNNAYWAPLRRPLLETSTEEWQRTIDVTLTGVFFGCKHALPIMIDNGRGTIVNTASIGGFLGATRAFAAYMAAKGGVVQLTRSVALDYGSAGIRCNAVCPGLVRTAATAPLLADPERVERISRTLPVGRLGEPDDIANAVLYLASDESSYMTGQTLTIDGGTMIS